MMDDIQTVREDHDILTHLPGDKREGCDTCVALARVEAVVMTARKRHRHHKPGTGVWLYCSMCRALAALNPTEAPDSEEVAREGFKAAWGDMAAESNRGTTP